MSQARLVTRASLATGSPSSKYEHLRASALLRNITCGLADRRPVSSVGRAPVC